MGSIRLPHQKSDLGMGREAGFLPPPTRLYSEWAGGVAQSLAICDMPESTHAWEGATPFVPGHTNVCQWLRQVSQRSPRARRPNWWTRSIGGPSGRLDGGKKGHMHCPAVWSVSHKAGLNQQWDQPVLLPEFQGAQCSTSVKDPIPPAGGRHDHNTTCLSHHASEPC